MSRVIGRRTLLCTFAVLLLLGGALSERVYANQNRQRAENSSGGLSPTLLEVRPSYEMALGSSTQYFGGGGALDLAVDHRFGGSPFYLTAGIDYAYLSTPFPQSVSVATLKAGGGLTLPLGDVAALFAFGTAGYYFGTLNDFSVHAADPYLGAGAGVELPLSGTFALQLGVRYDAYLGLYQGISFGLGSAIGLGKGPAQGATPVEQGQPQTPPLQPLSSPVSPLQITKVDMQPIFPIFYSHYADHPIGDLLVKNDSSVSATNLKVTLFAKEYMDNPTETEVAGTLAPDQTVKVRPGALFTQSVLNITEGTKSSADVTLSYQENGRPYTTHKVVVLDYVGRNGMTWNDTRKAAAFVTSQDPDVLLLARSVASYVESKDARPINQTLEVATAFHDELDLYGINYVPNPVTPYSKVSNEKNVVDYLQFPEETLEYKSGDCSDLAILYSAMFESVGIPTAFITIPGHIFIAVDTELTPQQAANAFIPLDALIKQGGKEWVPVEVTSIHGGFLKAWRLGANEWYQNELLHQAGFYPVEAAWKVYKPVALPGPEIAVAAPSIREVYASYSKDMLAFADLTVRPQIALLQRQIERTGSIRAMNNLGILYARWGDMNPAEREFKLILSKKNYLPSVLNLGNLYYLRGDWDNALLYYRQARSIDPNDPLVLLSIAKVSAEMENFGTAKLAYAQLHKVDPSLAEAYSYLGEGPAGTSTRSANVVQERKEVVWDGE